MKFNIYQKICLGFFILITAFHIWISVMELRGGFYNNLYSFLIGLAPLIAGIIAIRKFRIWSGFKSSIGRGVFFIGLGIFCWGAGEMIWSYYNFFMNVPAPYPSLADLGFAPSIFFYGLGAFYLSSVTGARFSLKDTYAKIFVVVALIVVSALSYYLLVIVARDGVLFSKSGEPLKIILDIAYPVGDFFGLLLAVITSGLSYKYLGGKYRYDIFAILIGIGVMFIGDTVFSYTTTVGTFYNGNLGDFIFTLGIFFLCFGVLGFVIPSAEIKLHMLNLDIKKNVKIFNQILVRIIKKQERIMGYVALDEAKKVAGLNIDQSGNVVFNGDEKEIINRLVMQYGRLFGKASYEVSKEAVKDLIVKMPPEEVPSIFNKNIKFGITKKMPEKLYSQNLDLAVQLEKAEKNLNLEKDLRKSFTDESEETIKKIESQIFNKK